MSVYSTDDKGVASILVVDDTPENLRLLVHALRGAGHQVRAASSGALALRMARAEAPDLILLDVDMPEMDGFEVFEQLRKDEILERVPTLFISAIHDFETKARALRAGGRDYVTKPFHIAEVLARVATQIDLYRLERRMRDGNARLQRLVAEQVQEISDAQLAIIIALATLTESRDDTSGQHVGRISEMSQQIAEAARALPTAPATYSARFCQLVGHASALHDVGKVGIPDAVLLKPGRHTPEEWEVMKTHSAIGAATLRTVLSTYPRNELLRIAADIAACHHERWDGKGYPEGLAGEDIPVAARIVAVADVYDAVRSARPYKPAQTHAAASQIILDGAGTHFDPLFVAAFESVAVELDAYWCANQSPTV